MKNAKIPYSKAADNNKAAIFDVLQNYLHDGDSVLEIASGTAQHVVYFASLKSTVSWQPTELNENLGHIQAQVEAHPADNILPALELDVCNKAQWPKTQFPICYGANIAHIFALSAVDMLFALVGRVLVPGGNFLLYGPFNVNNKYTSASNREFDAWLKSNSPEMGIRDIGLLEKFALVNKLYLDKSVEMPANNKILCFKRD